MYNLSSGGIMKRIKNLENLLKEGILGARGDSDSFSTLEIFEIAELIEREEENFYKKSAVFCKEPELRDLYLKLAEWREKQANKISDIQQMFSERTGEFLHIVYNEQPKVAKMMASLAMFTKRPFIIKGESVKVKKEQILLDAMRRAEEAIIYYNGLIDFAGELEGQNIIKKIIREERHQIENLRNELKSIKG
jgi:rubrerythrin